MLFRSLLVLALVLTGLLCACGGGEKDITAFQEKAELLRGEALADWVRLELGDAPAGSAGHVVFLSVCDGTRCASVFQGTGGTLDEAWDGAVTNAGEALKKSGLAPKWLKADLVYLSGEFSAQELEDALDFSEAGFLYYGAAFDTKFETALLEAELNANRIYDYENSGIDLDALNGYLKQAGRTPLKALPDTYRLFRTAGWICCEDNAVLRVSASGLDYGRRIVEDVTPDTIVPLIGSAAAWLSAQADQNGALDSDPALHAQALSALLQAYRLSPSQALKECASKAAEYLTRQVVFDDSGRAFLRGEGEFTLEGGASALSALEEYMALFQTDQYLDLCQALGAGILTMQDPSNGSFVHTLDPQFAPRDAFRSAGWDGAALYALCGLYGLTDEDAWLDAVQSAAGYIIAADYAKYGDSRVAIGMDRLTEYVPANADYYAFALENGQKNLEGIASLDTSSPAGLELLMASYRTYDRMTGYGGSAEGFHLNLLLNAIRTRVQRQLDGFFFPEYAMYMAEPQAVLGAFMTREEGFAIRKEVLCRHISGYALYCGSYEQLLADGLNDGTN